MMPPPKKLIEVALPLEEINAASVREKSIRHGHPSTLHLWWARRPLGAARTMLFGQLVDDPSGYVEELQADPLKVELARRALSYERQENPDAITTLAAKLVERERERLFEIIRELVKWENTNNETVLEPAREEIRASWRRTCRREGKPADTPLPPVLDPFAGGGAIPLEAQRLGLEAHASDLNPVAVLINKAMIEIPPKFADLPPVHLRSEGRGVRGESEVETILFPHSYTGAQGLAADVRHYGQWMRGEAFQRIGHLYPPYTLTQELLDSRPDLQKAGYQPGDQFTVIAWLWAHTVPSPNPALGGASVPLVSSFWLSKKKGKEVYVEPVISGNAGETPALPGYRFEIRVGKPEDAEAVNAGTKTGRGANFRCLLSGVPLSGDYVKTEGKAGRMGARLMAVVCERKRGRVYLSPNDEYEDIARTDKPILDVQVFDGLPLEPY